MPKIVTWADRWLEPLIAARELRSVMRKGKITAQRKRVTGLNVRPGLVTADVVSETGGTMSVKLRKPVLQAEAWERAFDAIGTSAQHSGDLIAGRLTDEIVTIFDDAGAELFHAVYGDVVHFCTCAETRSPVCSHAIATEIALSQALQKDIFVLFEFLGRPRDQVMDAMRERRQKALATSGGGDDGEASEDQSHLTPASELADGFWERGVIPHLAFHFTPGEDALDEAFPVIRALGPAPGDTKPEDIADVLAPLARQAVKRLDEMVSEPILESSMPSAPDPTQADTLDDMLVAAAHQHGALTTSFVSNALGITVPEARQYLAWLVEEGRLKKTGRARGTKYLPADSADAPADSADAPSPPASPG